MAVTTLVKLHRMVKLKTPVCPTALLVAVALNGCVSIPCGTETFTTEYPAEIRATADKAEKTYAPSVAAEGGEGGSVDIGLFGEITVTQPRSQHYNSVSLTKQKRLAVGVYPWAAEMVFKDPEALVPVYLPYVGNGLYSSCNDIPATFKLSKAFGVGRSLNVLTLGLLPIPFEFLHGLFGSFEHGRHYLGKALDSAPVLHAGYSTGITKTKHDSRDLDLLAKFPEADRRQIGAWTWRHNADHPQNTFWRGFTSNLADQSCPGPFWPLPGIAKYCVYVVHEPVELERTTPAVPETTLIRRGISGPYGVFLQVPEIGLARTLVVPRGEKTVRFTLAPAESGMTSAQATVRFLPPPGGLEEACDEDARALLEQVSGRDFPLEVELPVPRIGKGAEW